MSGRAAALAALFDTDLDQLRTELEAYPDDSSVWRTAPGISNPAGTLALHLAGNLQHFVGAVLGGTGYVRDRDAEFAKRDVPRAELLAHVAEAKTAVARTLGALGDGALERPYGAKVPPTLGESPTVEAVLVYMYGHFAYHLGQVNYHRRLLAGSAGA